MRKKERRRETEWVIPVLLAVGAGVALWYYWMRVNAPEPPVPEEPPPAVVEEEPPHIGPVHPIAPPEPDVTDRPDLVPLPPLDQSDEYFKLEIDSLYGDALSDLLEETGIIERIVATVDNLPRSHVAERIRPVGRLSTEFDVDGREGGDEFTISSDNHERYRFLVDVMTSVDAADVIDVYRRFYPLFQSAYVELGYPDAYFNDRLVEVIDHLLETPEPEGPLVVVRPNVLFEYADPALESLSSGQKLLLRMGPENATRVKQVLEQLREEVTQAP